MNKKSKIGIIGAGIEGCALANYLHKKGHTHVTVLDKDEKKKAELPKGVHKIFGKNYLGHLDEDEFDILFRSPGVPFLTKEIQEAKKRGTEISSLTKYFFEHCPCPIIGVTGTKGKGTVSTLIAEILKTAGNKVFLGGNIGKNPLEFLDKLSVDHYVVLELSSFQLQDLDTSPHIGVLLDITSEHLDHHKDRNEYIKAKQNLISHQKSKDIAIYNKDSKTSAQLVGASKGRHVPYSANKTLQNGFFINKDTFMFRRAKDYHELFSTKDVQLMGPHNLENVLAAIAVAGMMDIPPRFIQQAVKNFKGLPHRLQLVKKVNGVSFYDDSYATSPDPTIAALRAVSEPTILIVGGSDKGADYKELGEEVVRQHNLRAIISLGETAARIEEAIDLATEKELERIADALAAEKPIRTRQQPLEFIRAQSFPEACMVARLMAQEGDTVLLSPASASFDMFKNATERGELWQKFVESL